MRPDRRAIVFYLKFAHGRFRLLDWTRGAACTWFRVSWRQAQSPLTFGWNALIRNPGGTYRPVRRFSVYLPKSALTWLSQIMGLVVLSACVGGQVSAADADEQVRSAGGPDSPSQSAASQPAKKQPAKPKEKSDTFEATAPAQEDMADLQSVDAFNSIEDGQPGAPGERELQIDAGWRTRPGSHDPFTLHTEIKYTPTGSDFLRNMKLELSAPLELGLGGTPGNGDLVLGWKQRWVTDHDWVPSLSTLAEVRAPSGYRSSGVDGTLTGIAPSSSDRARRF